MSMLARKALLIPICSVDLGHWPQGWVHAAVICDRFPIFLLMLAFSSNVLVRSFQRSGGMPAKFSSMSSSGAVENLSLQLFQALNGTERHAVQAYKLLS